MKRLIPALVLLTVLTSLIPVAPANAQGIQQTVPTWDFGLSGSNTLNAKHEGWAVSKDYQFAFSWGAITGALGSFFSWDGLMWILKEGILKVLLQQIKQWAASGFQGKPYFLEHPEDFFKNVADEAAGVFIEELGKNLTGNANFFCEDFIPTFVLDWGAGYGGGYYDLSRCTLTDVVANIQDYYNDFEEGNWQAYLSTRHSGSNVFSFYLDSLQEKQRREIKAKETYKLAANSGGGYLPSVKCGNRTPGGLCEKWIIQSPAKAIADRVTAYVGSDIQRIIPADELTEVVTAVLTGIAKLALDELSS